MKTAAFAVVCLALISGCRAPGSALVPEEWYRLPEDGPAASATREQEVALGSHVDRLLGVQRAALDALPGEAQGWHLEYMLTDLAISAGGTLGTLIMKGTPSVMLAWRKQYERKAAPGEPPVGTADLLALGDAPSDHLARELEPSIRAAVDSGKVRDEAALRRGLLSAAADFTVLARQLARTEASDWWVSRYRVDLAADASGNVTPATTLGAEVRFRFEWHRMMRKTAKTAGDERPVDPELARFVSAMIQDLREVTISSREFSDAGFQAYGFRVGVGFTAKGTIAIGKSSSTITGQVYFSTNARKPVPNPSPTSSPREDGALSLLDEARPERMSKALSTGVPFREEGPGRVSYRLDRAAFRDGLRKATSIGGFFARRAARASAGKWKVYELRTALDLSFTGKLGLSEAGGVATAQVSFYNSGF
ncbi:MAG TPA: hypothetical protein VM598_12755 [Bdellovibrionota bacterium]|nr:hypothetical protein [Bdellovibrionota bacterium]